MSCEMWVMSCEMQVMSYFEELRFLEMIYSGVNGNPFL